MMYPYMTLADETEIVHSQIVEKDGMKKVIVNFERPTEDGFDSARCELPDYKWTGCILASNGSKISKKELNELMEFISAQFFFICAKWKEAFVTDEIGFYC